MSLATIDRVIALLSKHSGRDKIAKVLHYGARIIIWYYTNKGLTKNAKITEKFRQTIVPSIVGTLQDLQKKSSSSDFAMNVGLLVAHCCDMLYFLSDNLTFAASYDFISLPPTTVEWLDNIVGCYTWLVSVLVWIVWAVKQFLSLQCELKKVRRSKNPEDKEKEKSLSAQLKSTGLLAIALFCDLQLAVYFIKGYWSSQTVGVFGLTGGLIGLYDMF